MKHKKVLLATLLAASGLTVQTAYAASNWVGTANYMTNVSGGNDEDIVGPFSTYDFGTGVVLLEPTAVSGNSTSLNGFYQSFVTNHELNSMVVSAPNLGLNKYELTVVANFSQVTTQLNASIASTVINYGGSFQIYRDTNPNRSYTADSGFNDGDLIMSGTITGGGGSASTFAGAIFGANSIDIQIDSYDTSVFSPATIANGSGIFTLRLGNPAEATFLNSITSVLGNPYNSGLGDLKFAADGYATLAVPEAETYAMMLAGLGLVGFMARRRSSMFV